MLSIFDTLIDLSHAYHYVDIEVAHISVDKIAEFLCDESLPKPSSCCYALTLFLSHHKELMMSYDDVINGRVVLTEDQGLLHLVLSK